MKAHDAELDILFSDFPLIVEPEVKAHVYFPPMQKPLLEELRFLRKMFTPMGWTPAQVRYYYKENAIIEPANNTRLIHLFFGFPGIGENQPETRQDGQVIQLFFPQLHQIQSNLDIKNKVWLAMKPFAST